MHFTPASTSLHRIKHHFRQAASQGNKSTHHQDKLSDVELAASGWRQALQLGGAMIVPPRVVSNPAYPSKATPSVMSSASDNLDTTQGQAHQVHLIAIENVTPKPPHLKHVKSKRTNRYKACASHHETLARSQPSSSTMYQHRTENIKYQNEMITESWALVTLCLVKMNELGCQVVWLYSHI